MPDNKPSKRKSQLVRKSAAILGVVLCILIALYLWAIFRPTGIEHLRQEQQEFIASVPEREPVVLTIDSVASDEEVDVTPRRCTELINELADKTDVYIKGEVEKYHGLTKFSMRFTAFLLKGISTSGFELADEGNVDLEVGYAEPDFLAKIDKGILWSLDLFRKEGAGHVTPDEFNDLIDRWEEVLFSGIISATPSWQETNYIDTNTLMTCGALVILRAQHRGKGEHVDQYLRSFFPYALETGMSQRGKASPERTESNLMALVMLLDEMAPLDSELLADLQAMTHQAMFSREELRARRYQSVQYTISRFKKRLEERKNKSNDMDPYGYTAEVGCWVLDNLLSPLIDKNLDDIEKAMYKHSMDKAENAFINLQDNMKILFSIRGNKKPLRMWQPMVFDYYCDPDDALAYEYNDYSSFNGKLMTMEVMLASMRFHRVEKRWPDDLQELIPSYLDADYEEESGVKWEIYHIERDEKVVPVIVAYYLVRFDRIWSIREDQILDELIKKKGSSIFCQFYYSYLESDEALEEVLRLIELEYEVKIGQGATEETTK